MLLVGFTFFFSSLKIKGLSSIKCHVNFVLTVLFEKERENENSSIRKLDRQTMINDEFKSLISSGIYD